MNFITDGINIKLLLCFVFFLSPVSSTLLKAQTDSLAHQLVQKTYTSDLSELKKIKKIRALVNYSRTNFFFSKNGTPKGLQVDLLTQYEKLLNKGIKKESDKIHVQYIPTTFDRMIPDLIEGKGDIICDFITITPARSSKINFMSSKSLNVQERLVSQKSDTDINVLEDLAGKELYVLRGSSYVEHLKEINKSFKEKNIAEIKIVEADPNITTEDIFELINSGIVKYTVADDFQAKIWVEVLADIKIIDSFAIKSNTNVGWGLRKDNPQLQKSLKQFLKKVKKGSYLGNMLFKRYYKNSKWLTNPNVKKERDKYLRFISLFNKYGEQYGFDGLALAAQGYQESQLNNKKKSHRGAVGIMQLLPSTAADKNVGIPNISKPEDNIHAAAKYLAFLRDRYFSGEEITAENQMAFSWAAYNAGPAKVRKMRALTKKMGLNPNIWYANVEVAAAKLVGRETVQYVRNIFKYYIAYTLVQKQKVTI